MTSNLICPVCGQPFFLSQAPAIGATHCPRCSAYMAIPSGLNVIDPAGSIRLDTNRVTPGAARGKEWVGGLIVLTLLLLVLALLPVVYFVVGNALQQ